MTMPFATASALRVMLLGQRHSVLDEPYPPFRRAYASVEGLPVDRPAGTLWRCTDRGRELAICGDSSATNSLCASVLDVETSS
jgi:hypothetical protein